jgi:hypothetical protein
LLIFWTRPQHLNREEVERWARAEVGRLLEIDGVRSAQLTRLASASLRHGADQDWLLEVHLAPDADALECVEHELWRSWLGDLRLLGLRPQVVLAGPGIHLE